MGSAESFGVSAGDTVLVACSGGADSLALAVAARFVTLRMGVRCGLVTVDHGLQAGSDERAVRLAAWARERGFEPVDLRTVHVDRAGGPEAAARDARYAALEDAALEHGAAMVLLGHTRDDQAETVLLALARGSGPRGLAGMPERRERRGVAFVRPLLDVTRAETRAACEADGLPVWEDPHNTDPAYARSRVRPLVEALGAGVVGNLARTASLVGADSDYLDELAAEALEKALVSASTGRHATARGGPGGGAAVGDGSRRSDAPGKDTPGDNSPGDDASSGGASMSARTAGGVVGEAWSAGGDGDELAVAELARLAGPIRTRVLHAWALRLGAPGTALSRRHVVALEALVVNWHGQGAVALPGLLSVRRVGGVLLAERQGPNPED